MKDITKLVARALFEANPNRNKALQWEHAACPRKRYLTQAAAVLTTLKSAGFVIAPRPPSGEMVIAGAKAMVGQATSGGGMVIFGQPKDVYEAMLSVYEGEV